VKWRRHRGPWWDHRVRANDGTALHRTPEIAELDQHHTRARVAADDSGGIVITLMAAQGGCCSTSSIGVPSVIKRKVWASRPLQVAEVSAVRFVLAVLALLPLLSLLTFERLACLLEQFLHVDLITIGIRLSLSLLR
jgi:hypothetical protein